MGTFRELNLGDSPCRIWLEKMGRNKEQEGGAGTWRTRRGALGHTWRDAWNGKQAVKRWPRTVHLCHLPSSCCQHGEVPSLQQVAQHVGGLSIEDHRAYSSVEIWFPCKIQPSYMVSGWSFKFKLLAMANGVQLFPLQLALRLQLAFHVGRSGDFRWKILFVWDINSVLQWGGRHFVVENCHLWSHES